VSVAVRGLVLAASFAAAGCVGWSISREFFAGTPGQPPASIEVVSGRWEVARAEGLADEMPALAQASHDAASASLCVLAGTRVEDGALQVRLRTRREAPSMGGGVAWGVASGAMRYRVAELDAAAGCIRVREVAGGIDREIASAAIGGADGWRTLRVDFSGDDVTCQLDGVVVLETELDEAVEGGVGLYCPPASTSLFADFAVVTRR